MEKTRMWIVIIMLVQLILLSFMSFLFAVDAVQGIGGFVTLGCFFALAPLFIVSAVQCLLIWQLLFKKKIQVVFGVSLIIISLLLLTPFTSMPLAKSLRPFFIPLASYVDSKGSEIALFSKAKTFFLKDGKVIVGIIADENKERYRITDGYVSDKIGYKGGYGVYGNQIFIRKNEIEKIEEGQKVLKYFKLRK